jgi:hypothetical protein
MKQLTYSWHKDTDGFWYGIIYDTWSSRKLYTTAGYPQEAMARYAVELEYRRRTRVILP